jgi:hypothetical protein
VKHRSDVDQLGVVIQALRARDQLREDKRSDAMIEYGRGQSRAADVGRLDGERRPGYVDSGNRV